MPTKTSRAISARLNAAQVAISNALSDPGMLKLLAEYGYTAARIKEGQKLYESAKQALNLHKTLSGEQQYKTSEVKRITKEAFDAYQALAKVSRAIWLKDRSKLEALGLHGRMPKTTAGFLTAAYVLFDNASNAQELAGFGYAKTKLTAERAKITALDKMNQAQEAAKGQAQDSVRDQQKVIKALNEWMAMFIKIAKVALRSKREYLEKLGILARSSKTKAQRGAAKKAGETREKKKVT